MRAALLCVAFIGCNDADGQRALARDIAVARSEIENLKLRVAALEAPQAPAVAAVVDPMALALVQAIKRDPLGMSRAAGLKLDEMLDENGMVPDVEKVASAIRAKTIRMYGKETGQRALVNTLGPELGQAIFFERIRNPR